MSCILTTRSFIARYATRMQPPQQRFRSLLFKTKYVSRKRRLEKSKIQHAIEDEERDDTISEIIFGKPPKKPEGFQHGKRWPRTIAEWRESLRVIIPQYIASFEGYFPWWEDKGTLEKLMGKELKDKGLPLGEEMENALAKWEEKTHHAPQQVQDNLEMLKVEGKKALEQAKKNTGIYTKDDLRIFAEDMLRLANECVTEFMKGYRLGRDDEVDKMLTQYFQELDEAADALPTYQRMKRRGRNPKRRIRTTS
jgi:hypothetical protein